MVQVPTIGAMKRRRRKTTMKVSSLHVHDNVLQQFVHPTQYIHTITSDENA